MTKDGKNLRFNKEKNCKCGKIIKKKIKFKASQRKKYHF